MGFNSLAQPIYVSAFIMVTIIAGIIFLPKIVAWQSKTVRKKSATRPAGTNSTSIFGGRDLGGYWDEDGQVRWHHDNNDKSHRLMRKTVDAWEAVLEGGTMTIVDKFRYERGVLFIRHRATDTTETLYVIQEKCPRQLQKVGSWPTMKPTLVKAFRAPYSGDGYYRQIPLILIQSDDVSFIHFSTTGEVSIEHIIDANLKCFLTLELELAIPIILRTDNGDQIDEIDEIECRNAIDITFSVVHASQESAANIDVYRLRFKDLKLEVTCLHQACTYYSQGFRENFFAVAKDGRAGLYRRLTNEAVVEGFDAMQSWSEDTVRIDDVWHYAFIGVKDGVPMIVVDGIAKPVPTSLGAAEVRIIDGEAFYQLERSDDVYDLYRYSDQKLVASFYGESPYLERQELSPSSYLDIDEDDASDSQDKTPREPPHHRLAIRIN